MSVLDSLKSHFTSEFPRLASGQYIHIIALRHSQSFPIFQTDGVLNTARTQAGLETKDPVGRLVMFKRKQTTPERLAGRELLRSMNLTSAEDEKADNYCAYNGEKSCKKCPDCILYGFAIGDSGAERSKVYSDSAFSLTPYETSHHSMTFNAPSEGGTMSEGGQMRHSINEQDHVIPEVTFPAVETLRDTTYEGFLYVLGNFLRTRRYGAQESRTGTMKNHIVSIAFCDGEIFSNLHFTQALYDAMKPDLNAPIDELKARATTVARELLDREPVRQNPVLFGEEVEALLEEVGALYRDETRLTETMGTLYQQTLTYAQKYGAFANPKKKSGKSKS
ncbi:type I-D CRISPR-associated protein Cas7/Csc2 [Baaleninema simplex]|uniref:type I-D CRISPR-associated protein Cas7/Csc2 n=1 Tax=Baaleninema simplex TaxID=2862350 RepID=UPI0003490182|nr:type I-D CRISPR-associated protein Cas7/Csc2 [Baaleninema simplex]